jgi:site-specific DNA-adenine methylase
MTGYVGGKNKIALKISNVILTYLEENEIDSSKCTYLEPFCGMCSISKKLTKYFKKSILADGNSDLIELWKMVEKGWNPPDYISKEEYNILKNKEPSPLRTFVGYACSFRNKFFAGYMGTEFHPDIVMILVYEVK